MRIAALTPVALGAEVLCADQCRKMFDEHITLPDLWTPWDDYARRLALLALARRFEFVVWIDADERFGPEVSRRAIESEVSIMLVQRCMASSFKVKEMWNEKQWRTDGHWGNKSRIVLQRNPLFIGMKLAIWENPDAIFHKWPLQSGETMKSPLSILHYGMSTPEKRKARVDKWVKHDPNNEHQPEGYQYMLLEDGLQLESL